MDISRIIRQKRIEIVANLIAGTMLFGAGLLFTGFKVDIVPNHKAVFALGFIPLSFAFSSWIMLNSIKKHPGEMKEVIISINDERLTAARNEAEAMANRIIRWLLRLAFFGYTLILPADVFTTTGWWLIFTLFCLSYMLPLITPAFINGKPADDND